MILLVVSIGVAFGVGYWSGTLNVLRDKNEGVCENLWLLGTEVVKNDVNNQWNISVTLENRGQENSTVDYVLINRRDINPKIVPADPIAENVTVSPSLPVEIKGCFFYGDYPGNRTITITIKYDTLDFSSGITIEIIFHTEAGWDYPVSIILP